MTCHNPFIIVFGSSNSPLQPFSQFIGRLSLKTTIIALIAYFALFLSSCDLKPAFAEQGINWDKLVSSVIMVESKGNPNAVSPQGCIGLMQINPNGALKEYNQCGMTGWIKIAEYPNPKDIGSITPFAEEDLIIPRVNKKIGTWYLHRLHNHYKCPTIEHILGAYNGGITRLKKNNWDINKMSYETRNYVKKVMKLYNEEL